MILFHEKDRGFNSLIIRKVIGLVPIKKIWVENTVFFAIQHVENRKKFC